MIMCYSRYFTYFNLSQAIISIRRLSRFLSCPEHEPENTGKSPALSCAKDHSDMAIIIHDACCTWSSSDKQDLDLILDHVTVHLPKGSLVSVIGEVRSVPEVLHYTVSFFVFTVIPFVFFVCWVNSGHGALARALLGYYSKLASWLWHLLHILCELVVCMGRGRGWGPDFYPIGYPNLTFKIKYVTL